MNTEKNHYSDLERIADIIATKIDSYTYEQKVETLMNLTKAFGGNEVINPGTDLLLGDGTRICFLRLP